MSLIIQIILSSLPASICHKELKYKSLTCTVYVTIFFSTNSSRLHFHQFNASLFKQFIFRPERGSIIKEVNFYVIPVLKERIFFVNLPFRATRISICPCRPYNINPPSHINNQHPSTKLPRAFNSPSCEGANGVWFHHC